MNALNTQSKKSDIDQLHYYVVPAQWMRVAWPVLQGQEAAAQVPSEWRELVGRIEACSLVSWKDQSVISDEEEEDSHRPPPHVEQKSAVLHELHKMHKTEGSPKPNGKFGFRRQRIATLDRGRKHVEDFFLLGSDTWTLVSNKFGFDDELRLNCVWEQQEDSTLSVVLHEANGTEPRVTLPIPASGRFGYQEILKNQALALGNGAAAAASLQPGNVSDDETTAEGPGDLVGAQVGRAATKRYVSHSHFFTVCNSFRHLTMTSACQRNNSKALQSQSSCCLHQRLLPMEA